MSVYFIRSRIENDNFKKISPISLEANCISVFFNAKSQNLSLSGWTDCPFVQALQTRVCRLHRACRGLFGIAFVSEHHLAGLESEIKTSFVD